MVYLLPRVRQHFAECASSQLLQICERSGDRKERMEIATIDGDKEWPNRKRFRISKRQLHASDDAIEPFNDYLSWNQRKMRRQRRNYGRTMWSKLGTHKSLQLENFGDFRNVCSQACSSQQQLTLWQIWKKSKHVVLFINWRDSGPHWTNLDHLSEQSVLHTPSYQQNENGADFVESCSIGWEFDRRRRRWKRRFKPSIGIERRATRSMTRNR